MMRNEMREFGGRNLRRLAIVGLTIILASCSSVPDAANPVEWYKGARDFFTSDEKKQSQNQTDQKSSTARKLPVPGADEPFPKLSTVPARPRVSSIEERAVIRKGLVADREAARKYSDQTTSRPRSENVAALSIPPVPSAPMSIPAPITIGKSTAVQATSSSSQLTRTGPKAKSAPEMKTVTRKAPAVAQSSAPGLPNIVIPAENPDAPKMAQVTPYVPPSGLGSLGTIVISGSGVQEIGAARGAAPRPALSNRGGIDVSGTRSLSEFNYRGNGNSYQVATIMFSDGSSQLKSKDRRILRLVAKQHKQVGGTIRVVGHASSRTKSREIVRHKMVNFQISAKRAETVAKALVKFGAKASNLYVGAVSDSDPRYHEYMPSGEAGNRRTEIYIDF